MATQHIIKASLRKDEGKGASRRLRRAGQVPAIVYGGHQDPLSIQFDHHIVYHASHSEWFYSAIIDLDMGDSTQQVILRDMQRHPFKQQIMHLDFQRITAGEAITVSVPLHFLNQDKSPAGKSSDVVITHELNEIEISCLPKNLPEFIEIDLSALKQGDTVHLSQITLPEGVSIPELKLGREHDVAVVIARHGRVEEASTTEEGEAEGEEK